VEAALPFVPRSPATRRAMRRALRDGLVIAGLLFAGYLFVVVAPVTRTFCFDAYAYWHLNPGAPYTESAGGLGAFTYTPVIVRLFAPFASLSWYSFLWLWSAVLIATVIWLGWRSSRVVLAFPPVALELYHDNVHLLIAAAIPAAALLVAWGGRTDRAWTVPVAATLGLPILWPTGFAILAALWPIAARRPGVTSPDVFGVRAATAAVDPAASQ